MSTTSFESLLAKHGYRVKQTTTILPPKVKTDRTGKHLSEAARKAGDCWYYNAAPLARFLYSQIDKRFEEIGPDPRAKKRRSDLMDEVKSILNEHRNKIVEHVLPMYDVIQRGPGNKLEDGEELPHADAHARDFFVRNVYHMLVKTYFSWLPEFIGSHRVDELESAKHTLGNLAQMHSEKLEQELRNFQFGGRLIVAPPIEKD